MTTPWVEPPYPAEITTHVAQAQAQLLAQYQQSPNMLGLIAVSAGRTQLLENALYAVMTQRSLVTAYGQQLDNLGKVIGLARAAVLGGNVDAVYAAWMKVQILVNASAGTAPNLIAIVQADGDVGNIPTVFDSGAMSCIVKVGGVATSNPSALSAALQQARAAGVHLVTYYLATTSALSFTYDGTSAQAYDNGLYAGAL